MHQPGRCLAGAAVAVAVAVSALAGCTATSAPMPTVTTDTQVAEPNGPVTILGTTTHNPPGFTEFPSDLGQFWDALAWDDPQDPTVLNIMIRSGSSCPYYPTEYSITPDGGLTITVEMDLSKAVPYEDDYLCTADDAQMTTRIGLPVHVGIPDEITVKGFRGKTRDATIPVRSDFP